MTSSFPMKEQVDSLPWQIRVQSCLWCIWQVSVLASGVTGCPVDINRKRQFSGSPVSGRADGGNRSPAHGSPMLCLALAVE